MRKIALYGLFGLMNTSALAGDLNPPAGPIAPTHKTLTQVEPRIVINGTNTPGDADSLFKITQPGSYYLAGSLTGVINKSGIEVAASDVTIDLNGFEVVGVPGTITVHGIFATMVGLQSVSVRNGTIREWGGNGVSLGASIVSSGVITDVRALDNADTGLFVHSRFIVDGCTASGNGGDGFSGINECVFTNCVASGNEGDGFSGSNGAALSDCTAYGNGACGILCGNTARISRCTSNSNDTSGIVSGTAGLVTECAVSGNSGDGIIASSDSTVLRNTCDNNGFSTGDGAGILVSSDARVEGNHCTRNDRGIQTAGSRSRIDGNSCTANTVSFDIDGADNLVIRNTATGGNPNYSITVGNSVAPRVSVTDSDGWAGITNADHPWANFGH